MLAIDSAERGQLVGIIRIVELFAHGPRVFAKSLIEFERTLQPQLAFIGIAFALLIRLRDCLPRICFTTLFAIYKSQLVENACVMWIAARSLHKPFAGGWQIAELKACKSEIVSSV